MLFRSQLVRHAQAHFPATLPGGVVDSFPAMRPVDIAVAPDLARLESLALANGGVSDDDPVNPDDH